MGNSRRIGQPAIKGFVHIDLFSAGKIAKKKSFNLVVEGFLYSPAVEKYNKLTF